MKVEDCISMMFSVSQPWSKQDCLDYAAKTGIADCFYSNRSAFWVYVKRDFFNRLERVASVKFGNPFYLGSDAEKIDAGKVLANRQIIGKVIKALCLLLCLDKQFKYLDELRESFNSIFIGEEYNDDIQRECVDRLKEIILEAVDMSDELPEKI